MCVVDYVPVPATGERELIFWRGTRLIGARVCLTIRGYSVARRRGGWWLRVERRELSRMRDPIRVLVLGAGQMGSGIACLVLRKQGLALMVPMARGRSVAAWTSGRRWGLVGTSASAPAPISMRGMPFPHPLVAGLPLLPHPSLTSGTARSKLSSTKSG